MPVKTVSWRQRSEPPYRRRTTSPRMLRKPLIPPDPRRNRTQSLSLTARVPSLSTVQTASCQRPMKKKVLPANTPRFLRSLRPSNVYIPIVPPLPIESLQTKKTTTVTRRRRVKRITWSLQLLVILSLTQTLEETTVPRPQKALDLPKATPPKPVTWTVLTTMVRPHVENLKLFL